MDKFTQTADDATELVRDMAGTHADFLRLLPRAVQDRPYKVTGDAIEIVSGNAAHIEISLGLQGVRRIGPTVALPITSVRYRFTGMSRQEIAAFLADFDRYYQRGGG